MYIVNFKPASTIVEMASIDPLEQYNNLSENLENFKSNLYNIIQSIQPLVQTGLVSTCQIAKLVTNKICWMTDFLDNGVFNNNTLVDNLLKVTKLPQIKLGSTNVRQPQRFVQDKVNQASLIGQEISKHYDNVKRQFELMSGVREGWKNNPLKAVQGVGRAVGNTALGALGAIKNKAGSVITSGITYPIQNLANTAVQSALSQQRGRGGQMGGQMPALQIYHPKNHSAYSIYSPHGKSLLKKYLRAYLELSKID